MGRKGGLATGAHHLAAPKLLPWRLVYSGQQRNKSSLTLTPLSPPSPYQPVWVVVSGRKRRQQGKGGGDELAARWKLERQATEARSRDLAREASRDRWARQDSARLNAARSGGGGGGDPWARDGRQRAESVAAARSMNTREVSWTRSMRQTREEDKRSWLGLGK